MTDLIPLSEVAELADIDYKRIRCYAQQLVREFEFPAAVKYRADNQNKLKHNGYPKKEVIAWLRNNDVAKCLSLLHRKDMRAAISKHCNVPDKVILISDIAEELDVDVRSLSCMLDSLQTWYAFPDTYHYNNSCGVPEKAYRQWISEQDKDIIEKIKNRTLLDHVEAYFKQRAKELRSQFIAIFTDQYWKHYPPGYLPAKTALSGLQNS